MKKILIAAGLTIAMSIGVSANENYVGGELIPGMKKFGKFTDYKSTPELMTSLEKDVPVAYYVINDYFSATNCTNDYMSRVSVEDVNVFAQSEFYGMLIGLVYSMPTYYEVSINGYRFVNCKDKNALQDLGIAMVNWNKRIEELKTIGIELNQEENE